MLTSYCGNRAGISIPGYFGFVKAGYGTVHLRLRQGDNEIILAVTDDQRFGWEFAARTAQQ